MWRSVIPVVFLCCLTLQAARCEEPIPVATEIIKDAIAAHGGKQNLLRLKQYTLRERGKRYVQRHYVGLDMTTWLLAPDHKKQQIALRGTDFTLEQTIVFDGDRGWHKASWENEGAIQEATEEQVETLRHEAFAFQQILVLYPLLEDPKFSLTSVETPPISGRPVRSVKVEYKGRPTLTLSFDRETNLLAKYTSGPSDDKTDVPASERFYTDYKDFDGLQFPTKTRLLVDGKPYYDTELVEIKFEKIDRTVFERPK